jgi:curved DNA-binding protein CbpA
MSYFERLDLPETVTDVKEVRRAYHRKSLQWHPDRWSGLTNTLTGLSAELYGIAVQGAFELIAEAYKELTTALLPESGAAASGAE